MISHERKIQLRVEMLQEYICGRVFGRVFDEETIYDIRDLLEDTFPSREFPTPGKEELEDA